VIHVRALERWNLSTGHLPVTFHYVAGGHTGNAATRATVTRLLKDIVSEGVTGSPVGGDE
jgi:hypothetical protein